MTDVLTDHEMLKALYDKFILGEEEPEPPVPPEPERRTAVVKVTADRGHLRFVDHLDGVDKAVWGSYPKGSDNPKRDRYIVIFDGRVEVYMDGKIRWGKYKGAYPGTGGNHGWEVVLGQGFNGHVVPGDPKLYILCKDAKRI